MADDLIGALTSRVRELSLRVATLESELDAAQRRVRVYEEFDQTIQDAMASALRSAFTVRQQAEQTASAIVDDARAQRSALLGEIEQLRAERERVQREVADARLTRDAVHQPSAPTTAAGLIPMSEMRLAASEALRGVFKELVDEIRSAPPPPPQAQQPRSASAPAPRVVDPVPPPPPARAELPPRYAPAEQGSPIRPPEPILTVRPAERPAERERMDPFPPLRADATAAPAVTEDIDDAPARLLASEPSSEIQLVLAPIPSFPRLVEIERRIQSLSAVRTLYVRDFRGGVATLAVGLRQPLTSAEFATALGGLEHPRLRVVSSTRNVLELRIDGEAAIA